MDRNQVREPGGPARRPLQTYPGLQQPEVAAPLFVQDQHLAVQDRRGRAEGAAQCTEFGIGGRDVLAGPGLSSTLPFPGR
jgi:hypothetical protein